MSIPRAEDFDEYKKKFEAYLRQKFSDKKLQLTIINNGTNKATEIYVDIEFPAEVKLVDENEIEDLEAPQGFPENPINLAEQEYIKKQTFFGYTVPNPGFVIPSFSEKFLRSSMNARDKQDFWIDWDNNTLSIKINNLLHTRQRIFGGYNIVPLKKGEFNAKVIIICAEYRSQVEFDFPIIVDECSDFLNTKPNKKGNSTND